MYDFLTVFYSTVVPLVFAIVKPLLLAGVAMLGTRAFLQSYATEHFEELDKGLQDARLQAIREMYRDEPAMLTEKSVETVRVYIGELLGNDEHSTQILLDLGNLKRSIPEQVGLHLEVYDSILSSADNIPIMSKTLASLRKADEEPAHPKAAVNLSEDVSKMVETLNTVCDKKFHLLQFDVQRRLQQNYLPTFDKALDAYKEALEVKSNNLDAYEESVLRVGNAILDVIKQEMNSREEVMLAMQEAEEQAMLMQMAVTGDRTTLQI